MTFPLVSLLVSTACPLSGNIYKKEGSKKKKALPAQKGNGET